MTPQGYPLWIIAKYRSPKPGDYKSDRVFPVVGWVDHEKYEAVRSPVVALKGDEGLQTVTLDMYGADLWIGPNWNLYFTTDPNEASDFNS